MDTLTRDEVDKLTGAVVLEFGASWCGYCQAIRTTVNALLAQYPEIRHIQIEDGPGRPLGRSFQVKLWPSFIFLREGKLTHRAVRPSEKRLIESFAQMSNPASSLK